MASPVVIADPDAWTSGYGLGLQLWRRGERVFAGHTGSMPGYLAIVAVHRPSGTGVVGLANAYTLHDTTIADFGLSLLEAVLEHEPVEPPRAPWRPGQPAPDEIEPLCGMWWWMGRGFQARWDADAGELVITATRVDAPQW